MNGLWIGLAVWASEPQVFGHEVHTGAPVVLPAAATGSNDVVAVRDVCGQVALRDRLAVERARSTPEAWQVALQQQLSPDVSPCLDPTLLAFWRRCPEQGPHPSTLQADIAALDVLLVDDAALLAEVVEEFGPTGTEACGPFHEVVPPVTQRRRGAQESAEVP